MKTSSIAILCALTTGGCAAVPDGRPPSAWPTAARDFATSDEAIRVAAAFPNSGGMVRRRLAAALEAKDQAAAIAALRQLAAMGAVLSAHSQEQVEALIGAEAMAPIAAIFDLGVKPIAASRVHAVIPAEHDLVEGVVWDSDSGRLYATTIVDRTLLLVEEGGISVAASGGLGSLFGGAYDNRRKRLWIAAGSVAETPKDGPVWVGLIALDPDRPGSRGTATSMPATASPAPSTGAGRAAPRSRRFSPRAPCSAPRASLSRTIRNGSTSPTAATASPRSIAPAGGSSRSWATRP